MLKCIEISGLFGQYSYKLPFVGGPRKSICFLTGPNGYGKSTILRLINAFIKVDARPFMTIPFECIVFYLNNYKVKICQDWVDEVIEGNESSENDDEIHGERKLTVEVYVNGGEDVFEHMELLAHEMTEDGGNAFPPSLSIYLASQKVEYVKDDRLMGQVDGKRGVTKAVGLLQKKIEEYDKLLAAKYNEHLMEALQSLSLESFTKGNLEKTRLLKRFNEKETAYRRLGLGISLTDNKLNEEDGLMYLLRVAAIDQSMNLEDPVFMRLNLLYDMVEKAEFANKTLELNKEHGLIFHNGENIIIPENLSSGEQHFIVQLITLLFKAEKGSLILVDEPELSYHPAWQMDYLKNLKRISEIGDYQFILATHSAQIFDYRWGYTIDLYKQSINDAEGAKTIH